MDERARILDLFAGAGGWDEGLLRLGRRSLGIELDQFAVDTALAAGHDRLLADVPRLDARSFGPVEGLVASPPCQAYSTAGKGLGRFDKPQVIACAHELAAGHDSREQRAALCRDERSLLTVEPLRWALSLRPRWVALEQVPAVLELWSEFAGLLTVHGYHVAAGVLSAEQYGVPQTRRRAFLIASLDGLVRLPGPTHRSYDPYHPERVAEGERELLPWVSMGSALGLSEPAVTFTNCQTNSGRNPRGLSRPLSCPARTLDTSSGSWTIHPVPADEKAAVAVPGGPTAIRVTAAQASVLQGFRPDYPWQGSRSRQFRQIGNAVCPPVAALVLAAAMRRAPVVEAHDAR